MLVRREFVMPEPKGVRFRRSVAGLDDSTAELAEGEAMPAARGAEKPLLRLVVCGASGSGKSTLIARLLSGYGSSPEEPEEDLGTPAQPSPSLGASRRHFSTDKRRFIVADTSSGPRCLHSMVMGASTADCAVVVADAGTGLVEEVRRHSHVLAVLGVRDIALVVNKLDTVDYSEARFWELVAGYRSFAAQLGLSGVTYIPISALRGDNVFVAGTAMPGYGGPTLIDFLEGLEPEQKALHSGPFRMRVQSVDCAGPETRAHAGTIDGGSVNVGDTVIVSPSSVRAAISGISSSAGSITRAEAGETVTITLDEDVDAAPGAMIADPAFTPGVADQIEATIVWVGEEPMLRGRTYLMGLGGATVSATITPLKYKLDVDSHEHLAATQLGAEEIGVCELELSQEIAFDPYRQNRHTGGFTLIDQVSNETVGIGLINSALQRAHNVRWQPVLVDKFERARSLRQQATVVWLTGLSGAGKSTIANLIEGELYRRGHHTYLLDGDNVRHGLNSDLGFTEADRVENIRRVAELAHLMVDAGLIVLVSFISPFQAERLMARSLFTDEEFLEVFVDAPLAVAEERDPKGLYRKARRGELKNFTGIDSPYEAPEEPDLRLDTTELSARDAAQRVIDVLTERGRLSAPARKQ
jgi:bifunctional enzyme CysN/CysC